MLLNKSGQVLLIHYDIFATRLVCVYIHPKHVLYFNTMYFYLV